MSSHGRHAPLLTSTLRLVGHGAGASPSRQDTESRQARSDVARENHAARGISTDDPRWLLAKEVERSIEGGRAAIIRPESRRKLVAGAVKHGLRPFDANLVIAIVQDAARHSEPLAANAESRISLIAVPERAAPPLLLLALAVVVAAGMLAVLVGWLMG